MNATSSQGFIEQAWVKVYSRGDRTVKSVAEEQNVNYPTIKNGMKTASGKQVIGLATSESLFKTLNYRPTYPQRALADLLAARPWVGTFVHGYNEEYRQSAIGFVTPTERHKGADAALLRNRVDVAIQATTRLTMTDLGRKR